MRNCSGCGALCSPANTFCTECGRPVPPAVEPAPLLPDSSFIALNGGRIAGMVTLLGFVLPWVSCGGNPTGMDLANREGWGYLWILPVAMIVALVALFARTRTFLQMRIAAGAAFLGGGAATATALYFGWDYYQWWRNFAEGSPWAFRHILRYGSWLSLAGAFAVAAAGGWQWAVLSRSKKRPRRPPGVVVAACEAPERRDSEQVLR